MRPSWGSSSLVSNRKKVDFPDPDGPTRKTNSPFWMSTDTSRTATVQPLQHLATFSSRELAGLVLARHDDASGQGRDAHGRVGDVDVLATRSRRAVRVDAQLLLVDLGLVGHILEERHEVDGRVRRLAPALGVERRDAIE